MASDSGRGHLEARRKKRLERVAAAMLRQVGDAESCGKNSKKRTVSVRESNRNPIWEVQKYWY